MFPMGPTPFRCLSWRRHFHRTRRRHHHHHHLEQARLFPRSARPKILRALFHLFASHALLIGACEGQRKMQYGVSVPSYFIFVTGARVFRIIRLCFAALEPEGNKRRRTSFGGFARGHM